MKLHKLLFANHGAAVYAVLILASGITLALSMPWASKLSELIMQPWRPLPFPFFLMYAVVVSLIALSIGAVAAPVTGDMKTSKALWTVLARVSFGHFLMLPLVAYSRVLFPGSALPLFGATIYVILLSVLMAVVAMLLEVSAAQRGRHSSMQRYGLLVLMYGLPLFGLLSKGWGLRACALVSPLQALAVQLSNSASASQLLVIYAIPLIGVLGCLLTLFRAKK